MNLNIVMRVTAKRDMKAGETVEIYPHEIYMKGSYGQSLVLEGWIHPQTVVAPPPAPVLPSADSTKDKESIQ